MLKFLSKVEKAVLKTAKDLGMASAKKSSHDCWAGSYYQKECPKSLIKEDK